MPTELIRQMLEAGVHFGHQTKRWNPKMKPFIFGSRSGIYIIDLEKTERHLKAAGDFLEGVAAKGQQVLFVGTKKQAKPLLEEAAKRCGMPYVVNRWLGGTLTNFQTIKKNLNLLHELRGKKADGTFEQVSKKERKRWQRQLDKLEDNFSGLADMNQLPACLFVVDTKREEITVLEANRLEIPIVALCDTNANPELIAYPIPGNDDAIRAVKLIVEVVAERVLAGRRQALVVQQAAQAEADAQAAAAKASEGAGETKEPAPAANSPNEG